MKLLLLVSVSALLLSACGAPKDAAPAESPTTTPPAPVPEAKALPSAAAAPTPPPPPAVTVKEPEAEKCEGGWVCVKIDLANRKVEPRETKLLGDPKIESTWSQTSDGRTVTFDDFSQGPLELTLRRLPKDKIEVVIKLASGGIPLVIHKRDGSEKEVTHVGAIATEQGGALLVDLFYQR